MINGGIILCNTSLVAVGSNIAGGQTWNGGQGVLVVTAQQYAPIVTLVLQSVGPQQRDIKVNSTAIQADVVMPLMLPAGRYAIHSATGTSIGLYASLMPTN